METLRLSWRNLWRNPRRTLITASALSLGVLSMVASTAYMHGIFGKLVETTANGRTGHAQLHAPGWRDTREEALLLRQPAALLKKARALAVVEAAAPRVLGSGLLAIGDRSRGVQIFGIQPEHEAHVGKWTRRIQQGRFVAAADGGAGEVVIGAPLAKRMQIDLDTRVVVMAADIETGEARSELLRVVGIARTSDPALDDGAVVVRLDTAQRLLGVGDGIHEVVLRLRDVPSKDRAAVQAAIAPLHVDAAADAGGVEAVPWHAVQPMVAELLLMQSTWMAIFLGMIFFVIAFVIVGTMSMALLERTWELGLMRALGTPPSRVAAVMLAEAGWLGLVGGLPGALGGYGLSVLLNHVGVHLGEEVTMVVSFHEPIRPVPDLANALSTGAIFVALTVLVSLVAALRASRVEPGIALRQR